MKKGPGVNIALTGSMLIPMKSCQVSEGWIVEEQRKVIKTELVLHYREEGFTKSKESGFCRISCSIVLTILTARILSYACCLVCGHNISAVS